MRHAVRGILVCAVLAGCGGDGGLRVYDAGDGPDEFSVIPARPLVIPDVLSLPAPTPGAANRTDPDPVSDAALALGGNPALAFAAGVPASDAALLAAVGGAAPDIRAELAAEDAAFRARAQAFRVWGGDRYFQAYARQALDAYAELARFAARGVAVPSAPPPE